MTKVYTLDEIKKFAIEYKECCSFLEVEKKFNIKRGQVRALLIKNKSKLDIWLPSEEQHILAAKGLKKCFGKNNCNEIKLLSDFDNGRNKCMNCMSKDREEWENKNVENIKEYRANYYKKNKDKKTKSRKEYYNKNKDKINTYYKEKLKNDINFKVAANLRSRLRSAIKKNSKVGSAVIDLGCSISELILYLEKQFYQRKSTKEEMTWENYGLYGWHIDHIKPLSSFNLIDRKQLLKACNYTNLQPLWAEDNLSKGIKEI